MTRFMPCLSRKLLLQINLRDGEELSVLFKIRNIPSWQRKGLKAGIQVFSDKQLYIFPAPIASSHHSWLDGGIKENQQL
jgi:hypothetical protein